MPLTGDFAKLKKLIGELESAGRKVIPDAAKAASEEAFEQYQAGFAGQRSPWGEAWKQAPHNMYVSGALANPKPTAYGGVARLRPTVRYWFYHQVGANNMAKRPVIPGIPSDWDLPIELQVEKRLVWHFTV